MTPTTHDDELDDLRQDLHDLASRWEVRPPDTRPDLTTPSPAWRRRGRLAAWLPRVAVAAAAIAAIVALALALLPRTAPLPDVVEGPTPLPSDATVPAPDAFLEQLDRLPAAVVDEGPLLVTMDDLERAAAVADVDPTGDQVKWLMGVRGTEATTGPFVLASLHQDVTRWLGRWEEVEAEVGWSLSDADAVTSARVVETGLGEDLPVGEPLVQGWVAVVDGAAARAPMPGAVADGDLQRLGPDDDVPSCLLENQTAARRRGCPLWIADGDATRTVSTSRAVAEAALVEDRATLASDEDLAAVVTALQEAGMGRPVSMTLVIPGAAGTHTTGGSLPSTWLAGGVALHVADDGTRQLWAAYEHATEQDAARNAAAMADAWTDVALGRGWDIETVAAIQQGSIVVAEVTPVTTEAIVQVLTTLESGIGPFRLADR